MTGTLCRNGRSVHKVDENAEGREDDLETYKEKVAPNAVVRLL